MSDAYRSLRLNLTTGLMDAAVTAAIAAAAAANMKGGIDCSANPNWPAGTSGDSWRVTVAGRIGGASGQTVSVGDVLICFIAAVTGTDAAVGANWVIVEANIPGITSVGTTLITAATVYAQMIALQPAPYAAGTAGVLAVGANVLNYNNGPIQKVTMGAGAVSDLTISNGADGAELELRVKGHATTAYNLTTTLAVPSDSALTWPKSITSALTWIYKFKNVSGTWKVVSQVGGF